MLGSVRRPGSWKVFYVITYALFLDYFIYGLIVRLTAYSPVKLTVNEHLFLFYGGYPLGVFPTTPIFGVLGSRVGGKPIVIIGVVLSGAATLLFWLGPTLFLAFLARIFQGAASAATWSAGLGLIA